MTANELSYLVYLVECLRHRIVCHFKMLFNKATTPRVVTSTHLGRGGGASGPGIVSVGVRDGWSDVDPAVDFDSRFLKCTFCASV